MNPRRFYIGFPPAVVKVTRKGIEYGIGAIPLGGYVKIPGMHRPAAADLDLQFARALAEDTGLLAPLERVKRALAVVDLRAGARRRCPSSSARPARRSSRRRPRRLPSAASPSCATRSATTPTGARRPGSASS